MPQLIVQNDPYIAANASALNDFAGSLGGGGIEAQAKAQALAAQIRQANAQQQKLQQDMRLAAEKQGWEGQDRQRALDDENAIGNYWKGRGGAPTAPGAPVPVMSPEEHAYWQSLARSTVRGTKGHDLTSGIDQLDQTFQRNHLPSSAPATLPDGSPVPQMPQGLAPDAQKKWNETTGKQVSDAQMDQIASQTAARKKLPELVNMRDSWESAAQQDAIGGFSATSPARWVAGALGTPREVARQNYEGVRAQVLNQNSGDHKGEGAVSNYERELYGKPYAEVSAASPEVGRTRMTDQFALTLRNIGVDPTRAQEVALHIAHGAPRGMIDHLSADLQRGNLGAVEQFLLAAREDAQRRMGGGR